MPKNIPQKFKQRNLKSIPKLQNSGILDEIKGSGRLNLPIFFYVVEASPPFSPSYLSPAFESFGYSLEEWRNSQEFWTKLIHENDRSRILAERESAIATGEDFEIDYRLKATDGSIHRVREKCCIITARDGKKTCQGAIIDLTESRKAKQEFEKCNQLYRTLARNIPRTAVLIFDRDLRFIGAEGLEVEKHGLSAEIIQGKTIFEIFSSDLAEEWARYYQGALAGGYLSFESKINEGIFECFVLPIKDENGEIQGGMSLWHDITERQHTFKKLEESEARYRELFEGANDLVYVHDLHGNYLSLNKAAERVFGYTQEEIFKLNMKQVIAPQSFQLAQQMMAQKLNAEVVQTEYEIDCQTKDGRVVTLEINSTLLYKNDQPFGIQGIARDITERKLAQQSLIESEERLRDLFENANDIIYTTDLEGNFTSLNRAGEMITGYTRQEAVRMNMKEVVAPEFLEQVQNKITEKLRGLISTPYEIEIIGKNGQRMLLELNSRLIWRDNKPVGVQGIGRDITERKQTEEALKASERQYRFLTEGIMHQVWTAQPDGKLDFVNQQTLEYFGKTSEDLLQDSWMSVVHPEDLALCLEHWTSSMRTGNSYQTEFRLRRHDGTYRWFKARGNAGLDSTGKIVKWFGTNTDVHDKKMAEERLSHFARHDPLTNLPNRAEFMVHLKTALARCEKDSSLNFAVLFLDLDRFKVINDSLGHLVGDKLLSIIAERLKSSVRPPDVVARLGGDEFTILLNQAGSDLAVKRVAERIQSHLSEPFKIDNYEIFTSASIGIVVSDHIYREPEDFLRDADTAMYRAKEKGKARCEIFNGEMHVQNMNLLRIENDLRRAIEREELRVFYQPIVELNSGEINEFEALIRWQHPVHGLILPNEFIKVAEETGLIIPIGKWILEEACRQTFKWQTQFPNMSALSIGVNLSAKQLMHPSLTAQVCEILTKTGLSPKNLKLEVTESVLMEHSETALSVLNELHTLGVSLSTDDFGTGYSSLSYLHRFPFNRLKIDRSFIGAMSSDSKIGEIVRTILILAQNLRLEAVAEGIETQEQLQLLQDLGCPFGQGYLFSQPLEAESIERFLPAEKINSVIDFPAIFQNYNHDVFVTH